MITEVELSAAYSSAWRAIFPNSENVVAKLNKSVKRFRNETNLRSRPARRGFVNEIAFHLFAGPIDGNRKFGLTTSQEDLDKAIAAAKSQQARYFVVEGQIAGPTSSELREVMSIVKALRAYKAKFFASRKVFAYPKFTGCGILDACEGDLIIDDVLVEVKSGVRNFRSIDIRQVMTYCALNFASGGYVIKHISFVNPRRGIYFMIDLETLCLQLSSSSAAEVFSEIIYFLSSGDVSR